LADATSQNVRLQHLARNVYNSVISSVTNYALQLVEKHFTSLLLQAIPDSQPIRQVHEPCTGRFSASQGLPCRHIVIERMKAKRTLKIDDFHEHWYVDRASVQVQPPILDPLPVVSRSLSGNTGSSSTKRTLSHWEQVERPVRKCTVCKQPGHNKNSLNCSVKLQQLQAAS